jgi:hypothetical protein
MVGIYKKVKCHLGSLGSETKLSNIKMGEEVQAVYRGEALSK